VIFHELDTIAARKHECAEGLSFSYWKFYLLTYSILLYGCDVWCINPSETYEL